MDILVATGKLAENTVKKAVGSKAEIIVIDIEIAAFITPRRLAEAIDINYPKKCFDMIFIPGLVSGNFINLAKKLNTKIFLGPKHAYDLSYVLDFVGKVEFSTKVPACELLADERKKRALKKVEQLEDESIPLMYIKNIKLGGNSRMKVLAEIVNATGMSEKQLQKQIEKFVSRGADMIDLGASLNATPEEVQRAICAARKITDLPISIDTLEVDLLKTAIENGIDMLLSIDSSNINEIAPLAALDDIVTVIIPDSGKGLESLIENIHKAQNMGINRIIADPVLDPIGHGIALSIMRYFEFHKKYPNVPIFFGVGNVTELFDVDSQGVNATLCGIGTDLGASVLFTPEYSNKTQGSISELKIASQMMMLSKERQSSPKDLGIDLMIIKEKRRRTDGIMPVKWIKAQSHMMWKKDPAGSILISIIPDEKNKSEGVILAAHKKMTVLGKKANEILDTLIELKLISRLEHAAYLGHELKKAELAIKFDRSYAQDDEF